MAKTQRFAAFPVFRTPLQGHLLSLVLLSDRSFSISEMSSALNENLSSVSREVKLLQEASVFTTTKVGQATLVSANREAPFLPALTELVLITLGPKQVLAQAFASVTGISEIHVFGSWAARMFGISGPTPNDIDVLVVGTPDSDQLYRATQDAEKSLRREVNVLTVRAEAWDSKRDPLLASLAAGPLVEVAHATTPITSFPAENEVRHVNLTPEEHALRSIFEGVS